MTLKFRMTLCCWEQLSPCACHVEGTSWVLFPMFPGQLGCLGLGTHLGSRCAESRTDSSVGTMLVPAL